MLMKFNKDSQTTCFSKEKATCLVPVPSCRKHLRSCSQEEKGDPCGPMWLLPAGAASPPIFFSWELLDAVLCLILNLTPILPGFSAELSNTQSSSRYLQKFGLLITKLHFL